MNEYKLSASQTAAGKLFHTTGPAIEKALSPNFVLVRGTVSTGRRAYLIRRPTTKKAQLVTVDNLTDGTPRRLDPKERRAQWPGRWRRDRVQRAVPPSVTIMQVLMLNYACSDIRDQGSYPAVVDWAGSLLEGDGLNVLVNNAGIAHWEGFDAITKDLMLDCLEINCIAPLMLAKVMCAVM